VDWASRPDYDSVAFTYLSVSGRASALLGVGGLSLAAPTSRCFAAAPLTYCVVHSALVLKRWVMVEKPPTSSNNAGFGVGEVGGLVSGVRAYFLRRAIRALCAEAFGVVLGPLQPLTCGCFSFI